MRIIILLISLTIFSLLSPGTAYAQTNIYIDNSAEGSNNGTSFINAFTSLDSINYEITGDTLPANTTVYIRGNYLGTSEELAVFCKENLKITGIGFPEIRLRGADNSHFIHSKGENEIRNLTISRYQTGNDYFALYIDTYANYTNTVFNIYSCNFINYDSLGGNEKLRIFTNAGYKNTDVNYYHCLFGNNIYLYLQGTSDNTSYISEFEYNYCTFQGVEFLLFTDSTYAAKLEIKNSVFLDCSSLTIPLKIINKSNVNITHTHFYNSGGGNIEPLIDSDTRFFNCFYTSEYSYGTLFESPDPLVMYGKKNTGFYPLPGTSISGASDEGLTLGARQYSTIRVRR